MAAVALATVVAGFAGACAPAPAPSAKVLLHVNSTCEAIASKTGDTWTIHLTRSDSRCGLQMGSGAAYRYGLRAGTIQSMIGRNFNLHVRATDTCMNVFLSTVTYQYSARIYYCRA